MFPLATRYREIRGLVEPADEQLERELRQVFQRAKAGHPDLDVAPEAFIEFLAARTGLDENYLSDLYLACAVILGVPGAAARLEAICVTQIPRALVRIDRSPIFIMEIQRRVRDKLIFGVPDGRARISEYAARGSLAAFVRICALREALMDKRTLTRARSEYHEEFQSALRVALAALDRNERAALRLSYLDNLGAEQIGRLFNVHRATAARWIARGQVRVRENTRLVLQRRLQLTDGEAESLVRDLLSVEALSSGMLASIMPSAA